MSQAKGFILTSWWFIWGWSLDIHRDPLAQTQCKQSLQRSWEDELFLSVPSRGDRSFPLGVASSTHLDHRAFFPPVLALGLLALICNATSVSPSLFLHIFSPSLLDDLVSAHWAYTRQPSLSRSQMFCCSVGEEQVAAGQQVDRSSRSSLGKCYTVSKP